MPKELKNPPGRALVLGAFLAASAVWLVPETAAAPATTRLVKPGPLAEEWLVRAALDELQEAAAGGASKLAELKERMSEAILARLSCGRLDQMEALNSMFYVLEACKYLSLARETCDEKFARWLADNRGVSRLLFRALEDVKSPKESLKVLHELVADDEKAVLDYPNLAAAFATSRSLAHHRTAPASCTMLEAFRWYTRSKQTFRYDLKSMPYELSRYLADSRLGIPERQWAAQNYANHSNPAKCYFDVKYDWESYAKKDTPQKIEKLDYTLQNLRQVGGVCIDQAYYASQVCKSLGIPSAIVSGHGSSGMSHAWVASLKLASGGQQAAWDTATGRYEEHQYFTGSLRDPARGGEILDSELMLAGFAAQLPLQRREEAHAATMLARTVSRSGEAPLAADLSALKKLADAHDKRCAGKSDAPKADLSQFKAERKIDAALMEDLLDAAIQRNLAHRPAWDLIVELGKAGRLPVDHLDRFFGLLVDRTAKQFPDYSCVMVMKIVPAIPDPARREKVYQRALAVYGSRPDLQGRVLVALGDEYVAQNQSQKAYSTFEEAATKCLNVSEVVMAAASKAENLLLSAGPRGREAAIKLYTKLFGMTKGSKSNFRSQTSHYQLGLRLADMLSNAGREAEARQVLKKIEE